MTGELDELLKGKTVIYCAHRLSSIQQVDKIHVLKDGEVKEEGTHRELLEKGQIYKEMWDNYMKKDTANTEPTHHEHSDEHRCESDHENSHPSARDDIDTVGAGCGCGS